MQRYARDDVAPQLRSKRQVLAKLQAGWRPHMLLHRGREHVDEAMFDADVVVVEMEAGEGNVFDGTEAESCSGLSLREGGHCQLLFRGFQCCGALRCRLDELEAFVGSWMLNAVSGCAHKASWSEGRNCWILELVRL